MLVIVGLGLVPEDISVRGVRMLKECDTIYLEKYTSMVMNESQIEEVVGVKLVHAYREDIEGIGDSDPKVLLEAVSKSIGLVVVGTPLFATTHTELVIRAHELGVKVSVLHNGSIQSVMGCCGFNSYGFGRTVSIPFFIKGWRPYEFYKNILGNFTAGLHTLCLLDIKINEPTVDTLLGKEDKRYTKFMSITQAIEQIEESAKHWNSTDLQGVKVVGVERFGLESERFTYGTLEELKSRTYGEPLHSLIVPGKNTNAMERECVERFFRTAHSI